MRPMIYDLKIITFHSSQPHGDVRLCYRLYHFASLLTERG